MKNLGRCFIIAFVFFIGTLSVIHVDRQSAYMHCRTPEIMKTIENAEETIENTIEKYASLR